MADTDSHKVRSVDDASQTELPGYDDSAADGSAPLTDWSAGQVILDDYVVERELGQGGMGKVYLLRSRSTGQPFAVKRAFLRNENSRRDFLAELRTWIDLPEHPHLVACRFFRTVGDEVVIFAEFMEGGSLADWIRDRRLTSLEQILDAAIQFAWGLHAAHELGLVHQDVKPGNALMTGDGLVKVADFGLARARATTEGQTAGAAGQSTLVSYGGMTPAYCSPEQAQRQPLSRQTDVWSWGVAVLEMFRGEVTWRSGEAAPAALTAYLKGPADPELPTMPNGVAEVLQKCFHRDPAERWANLADAAKALQRTYRQAVGKAYPLPMPAIPDSTRHAGLTHDRRTNKGTQWDDPREWLVKAFEADGRDPTGVEALLPAHSGSRKAQAIVDLASYEQALRLIERLVADGRNDLQPLLAGLCINKAFVHEYTDDAPGAVAMYDLAITIGERLVHYEGRRELADSLAASYMYKADAASALGDNRAAVALYDRAICIFEQMVEHGGQAELLADLATACMNKATMVCALGDNRAAVALYDRAICIFEQMVEHEGHAELANAPLALACMGKANAVSYLGEKRAAVVLYDRAIGIFEQMVEHEGHAELAKELAIVCTNKANLVSDLRDNRATAALYDRALDILERLVQHEGRAELANELATVCMRKADAVSAVGDNCAAVALYDRAIVIRDRLVEQEGRVELADDLATACMRKANAVRDLGDNRAAVALDDRVFTIYERLVEHAGRAQWANELAMACMTKAETARALGDYHAAVALSDQAIGIFEQLVEHKGKAELANDLTIACMNKAELANGLATACIMKAVAVGALGDKRAALALYNRAVAIYEGLVDHDGRQELQGDLACVVAFVAKALLDLGDRQKARGEARKAVSVLKAEIVRTDRADLQGVLDWATEALQEVL